MEVCRRIYEGPVRARLDLAMDVEVKGIQRSGGVPGISGYPPALVEDIEPVEVLIEGKKLPRGLAKALVDWLDGAGLLEEADWDAD